MTQSWFSFDCEPRSALSGPEFIFRRPVLGARLSTQTGNSQLWCFHDNAGRCFSTFGGRGWSGSGWWVCRQTEDCCWFQFFEWKKSAGALVLSKSRFMSSDYSVFNREQADDECDPASLDDTDQRLLTFSDTKPDVVTGHALWRQQFSTVAWLHMLNMRRERKAFIYTWVFSLFYFISQFLYFEDIMGKPGFLFITLIQYMLFVFVVCMLICHMMDTHAPSAPVA